MAEIIVPLDCDRLDKALALVDTLGSRIGFYKVGLELFSVAGPDALRELRDRGKQVFLDLKLHDIPATVARAAAAAAGHGASLLTVHAAGGGRMLRAAREGLDGQGGSLRPKILAVTVLTSMNGADLKEVGVRAEPAAQVLRLARLAMQNGADGVVCSPLEAGSLRPVVGDGGLIVTPGVRPAGSAGHDQRRIATPAEAVRNGATHLVVGRPITAADDPGTAASKVVAEVAAAGGNFS